MADASEQIAKLDKRIKELDASVTSVTNGINSFVNALSKDIPSSSLEKYKQTQEQLAAAAAKTQAEINDVLAKTEKLMTNGSRAMRQRASELKEFSQTLTGLRDKNYISWNNLVDVDWNKVRTTSNQGGNGMNPATNAKDQAEANRDIAQSARDKAKAEKDAAHEMNKAIREQIKLQKQLYSLNKEYSALISKPKRTNEEEQMLERIRKKMMDIARLQREIDSSNPWSSKSAIDSLSTDKLLRDARALNKEEKDRQKTETENAKKLREQQQAMQDMKRYASQLASALGLAFGVQQVANFVKEMVKVRGEFEMQQVALENIIGNKEKADEIWDKTLKLALQSPMTAMQLTRYTKQLAAFRIETSKLYDTTKMLADVSVGLGVDMQRLIYAYGHTKSSGFLRGMYARQFATAGVNIYGELAEYYSEVEKKAVSVRDVYDRISKKMVTYADVEQVFKKLTSEGGTFFNMQKEMSDTVQGQINKVKDAYQQMLNTIGKGNTGIIRDLVATILNLIQHWRTFQGILTSLAIGVAIGGLNKLMVALMGVQVKGAAAGAAMEKFALSIKGLGVALQKNWITLLITALVTAAVEIVQAQKSMDKLNASIMENAVQMNQTRRRLMDYQMTLEKNNETIKTAQKGSTELSEAQAENDKILRRLNKDYPELTDGMTIAANGYVNLTNKVSEYCQELERQIKLQVLSQQKHIFDDNFTEDAQDMLNKTMKIQNNLERAKALAETRLAQLTGKENSTEYKILDQIAKIDTTDIDVALEEYNKLTQQLKDALLPSGLKKLTARIPKFYEDYDAYGLLGVAGRGAGSIGDSDFDEMEKELNKMAPMLRKYIAEGILSIDEYAKEISDTSTEGVIKYWAENAKRIEQDIRDPQKRYDPFKTIRTFLEKNGRAETEEMRILFDRLINENWIAPSVANFDASWARQWGKTKRWKGILGSVWVTPEGADDKTETEPVTQTAKAAKESIGTLVELLKKMNTEYTKLKETAYGAEKSAEVVRDGYKDAFKEIFKTKAPGGKKIDDIFTMVGWDTLNFTSKEGVAKAIEELRDFMDDHNLWGKYQKDARKQVEKLLSEMKVEIGVEIEVTKREKFEKKMDELFRDYELTVELKSLDIPQDVAQNMFDFTYKTIGDLQQEMNRFYEEQKANSKGDLLDEKAWESYKKYAEKIEAEIYKMRMERAKKYSKLLENEISDRAKLVKEYYENLSLVSSMVGEKAFDEKQAKNISQGLTTAFKKALKKLDWETFKQSDFYVEMMEDLTEMPVKYMEIMLKEVNKVIEDADILPPRALKEAIKARREVQQAILSEASFRGMFRQTIGAFIDYRKSANFEADESTREAEAKLYKGKKTVATAGLIAERKLLRETVSIRAEKLAQMDKEIKEMDAQIGRLKAYEKAQRELESASANINAFGASYGNNGEVETVGGKTAEQLDAEITKKQTQLNAVLQQIGIKQERNQNADVSGYKKRVAELEQEIKKLQAAQEAWKEYNRAKAGLTDSDQGLTSTAVIEKLNEKVEKRDKTESRQILDKEALKRLKNFEKAWKDFSAATNDAKERVKSLGNATYEMLEATGTETNVLTDAWKKFGDTMLDTITGALTMIPQLVVSIVTAETAINAAMGIIGLIAEAIQLLMTLVTALAQLHDAQIQKDLDDSKKRVDALAKAYDKLKDAIDATITSAEYFVNYTEQMSNLNEQMAEAQFRLEEAAKLKKVSAREEEMEAAQDAIDDLNKSIREAEANLQETFGGIAKDDFRDWASEFVDAWTDAFQETGDGYQALMDTFEEKMLETFKKQALMRGLAAIMKPVEDAINAYVGDNGILDQHELADIRERMQVAADNGDAYLRQMAELFDLSGEGSLSGLTAGIQGMTEEQADVLTGYWNSVRLYAAETSMHVGLIADAFTNPESANPMLNELRIISANTNNINTLLDSLTKSGHALGGRGFKVFVS